MYKKVDKFEDFSKVFSKLDGEYQDKLVETAHQLLKTHQTVKNASDTLIFKDERDAHCTLSEFSLGRFDQN